MPKAAQPKPAPPQPPRMVQSAGNQDDFKQVAVELAAELGWHGDPDWVANDIRVEDAQNYIAKVMHEHFQAAAKGEDQPDYSAACEHLAVDTEDERFAIEAALAKAYNDGKGAQLESHPASFGAASASFSGSADAMLSKMSESKGHG